MRKEYIAVRDDTSDADLESYAGPLEGHEELLIMDANTQLEDLWVAAGLFPSVTQAKKNQHGGPIPSGFSDFWRKKKTIRLTILNMKPVDGTPMSPTPVGKNKTKLAIPANDVGAPTHEEIREPSLSKPLSMQEALARHRSLLASCATAASLK